MFFWINNLQKNLIPLKAELNFFCICEFSVKIRGKNIYGVSDGTWTHGHLGHNQVLYQLSYTHHMESLSVPDCNTHFKNKIKGYELF